jgi:hypothetical protein
MLRTAHPRHPRDQEGLVLEEVQVTPRLLRRVVDLATGGVALRASEARAPLEIDAQLKAPLTGIEGRPHHPPRLAQPQRRLKQLDISHRPRLRTPAPKPTRNSEGPKITGRFTGTTDEILQWAAHKWGWDEDVVRAVAVKESNYNQGAYTWPGSDQYQGGGIMSITWSQNPTSYLLGAKSTAFNVDVFLAYMRACFDGKETWMNQTGDAGQPYEAGDMWGCIGRWYAGRWYTDGAKWYIGEVKRVLADRTWEAPGY